MKIKLPIVTQNEIVDGKHVFKTGEHEFEMDMSLGCQMRWEAKFPELAARENFVDYTVRTKELESKNIANILSKMKAIYCFFETDLSFVQFVKMFDFTKRSFTEELIKRLNEVFEIVLNLSSEKN